jgi:hypothetical protein
MLLVGLNDQRALEALRELALHMRNFPKNYNRAIIAAINSTGRKARKKSIDVLSSRYWASKSKIGSRITLKKAKTAREGAKVTGRGRPMTIGSYKVQPITVTDSRGVRHKGLKAAVLKNERPKLISSGFIAKGMAFKRKGESSYPITAIYGPTAIGFLADEENLRPIGEEAEAFFEEELYEAAKKELQKLRIL